MPSFRRAFALFACLLAGACSSPASHSPGSGVGAPDGTGLLFDIGAGFVFDATALPDLGVDGPADLTTSDLGAADLPGVAGSFGSACQANGDCTFPFCVETASGKVCSQACTDSCPDGWTCATVQGASSDVISLCMPAFARLCNPCSTAADCNAPGASGNLCIAKGPLGSFCGASCQPDVAGACPKGYGCESLVDPATGKANWQCVSTTGTCACSPVAAQKGLQTACSSKNGLGSCVGVRTCASGTLSDCSAPVPTEEVCNGADDDCNGATDDLSGQPECSQKNEFGLCQGKITGCVGGKPSCSAALPAPEACNGLDDDCDGATDEDLCEDGNGCTQGKCNPDGSCQQVPLSGNACDDGSVCTTKDACVQGKCQGSASLGCDDGNPCTLDGCVPVTGCSHANQDGACGDDGNPCTLDQCSAGACDHVAMPSGSTCTDDGNPCTQDLCDGKVCGHPSSAVGTPCPEDGDGCTTDLCDGNGECGHGIKPGFCEIQGACVQGGTTQPGNACSACQPGVNPKAWTVGEGLACDDGDACTTGDACAGGVCKGQAKDCSAQGGVCTTGVCDKGTGQCVGAPKAGSCDDGDSCTTGDACTGGVCKGKVVDCSGLGNACNQAICLNGQCVTQPKGGTCDDGNPCTTGDACTAGVCAGKAKDCSALSSDCNTGTCQNGSCVAVAKPVSTGCNDQDACTSSDHCSAGKCVGTAVNCSAVADACNDGVCAAGACQKKAKVNGTPCSDGDACTLNDACASGSCKGTAKDCSASADACNDGVCSTGTCAKKAKANGVSCNDGSPCTGPDACSGGVCVGAAIKDLFEPDDTQPGKAVQDKTDCQDASSLTASISPQADVDWYHYDASDQSFCTIKPSVQLSNLAADYDVCVFFQCHGGAVDSGTVSCDAGTKTQGGPNGSWGCCSANTSTVSEFAKVSPSCSFLGSGDDGGTVWVRVQGKTSAAMCGGYTLQWSAKN